MTKSKSVQKHSQLSTFKSPHSELMYRSLVFARENAGQPLYFVAGSAGGPWNAMNALAASHKAHGGPCFYCKQNIAKGQGTIDHVEPLSLGGRSSLQNLVVACKPCNTKKGHRVIDAFNPDAGKEWLQALLEQVQDRLNRINPASSPPPPSPDAAGGP